MSEILEEEFGIIDFLTDDARGAKLLPEFLKNSDNVVALINAVIPEIQELHDAQSDVYSTVNILEAVGDQLDDIFGNVLDTSRVLGQTDDDYRAELLVATARFAKSGDIGTMKSVLRNLVIASEIRLYEYKSAHFKMEATVDTVPDEDELAIIRTALTEAKQGGNGMELSIGVETTFKLVESNPQLNSSTGLSGNGHTGGTLATGF